jgi:hypothetical protein
MYRCDAVSCCEKRTYALLHSKLDNLRLCKHNYLQIMCPYECFIPIWYIIMEWMNVWLAVVHSRVRVGHLRNDSHVVDLRDLRYQMISFCDALNCLTIKLYLESCNVLWLFLFIVAYFLLIVAGMEIFGRFVSMITYSVLFLLVN